MSDRRGCINCRYFNESMSGEHCSCCYDTYNMWKPEETPVTDDKNISMIKSIIDEAMEKRDRTVTVFISGENMHVSVTPLGADEPRWIPKDGGYVCSTCGRWELNSSRYCRICGETLKNMDMFTEESEEDDN